MTGMADCCARAASGDAATPASSMTNARPRRSRMSSSRRAPAPSAIPAAPLRAVFGTLRLPRIRGQVPEADLNCSESVRAVVASRSRQAMLGRAVDDLLASLGEAELRRHCREHPLIDDLGVALAVADDIDDAPRDRLLDDPRPAEPVERADHLVEDLAHEFGRLGVEAALRDKRMGHGHGPPLIPAS